MDELHKQEQRAKVDTAKVALMRVIQHVPMSEADQQKLVDATNALVNVRDRLDD